LGFFHKCFAGSGDIDRGWGRKRFVHFFSLLRERSFLFQIICCGFLNCLWKRGFYVRFSDRNTQIPLIRWRGLLAFLVEWALRSTLGAKLFCVVDVLFLAKLAGPWHTITS